MRHERYNGSRRGLSAGTVVMLVLTAVVLVSMALVLGALRGHDTTSAVSRAQQTEAPQTASASEVQTGSAQTVAAEEATVTPVPQMLSLATYAPGSIATAKLTFGGTVAVSGTIRKSCYYKGSKKYDFSELFDLLGNTLQSDLTVVSMENLTDSTQSMSDTNTSPAIFDALKGCGVQTVNLGFLNALNKGVSSLSTTVEAAQNAGLTTAGAYASAEQAAMSAKIVSVNGIRIAILHYTDGLSATNRKKLTTAGCEWMLPTTDNAEEDIRLARQSGADFVIVGLWWGKNGTASVSKAQRTLAQKLADAGADVIIGVGSRSVMTAETLQRTEGGETLCCYGIGSLMNEKRTNNAVAGMLLHLTIRRINDQTILQAATYTPTFIWHYDQDGADHYRTVVASQDAPEGMNDAQAKAMKRAVETVQNNLGSSSPLTMEK